MYGKNAFSTYKSVQVTTTDRGRLLLMLYEGAINFFKQSIQGIEEKNIAKFCRYLSKGQAIVAELMNTLDAEKGGKVANDLERLYEFILFYSTEANLHRDPARVQKCVDLLIPVHAAFKEIIDNGAVQQVEGTTQPQASAAPVDTASKAPSSPSIRMRY
jgi:flagellar protein FliS